MNVEHIVTQLLDTTRESTFNMTLNEMGVTPMISIEHSEITFDLDVGFPCEFLRKSYLPSLQAAIHKSLPHHTCHISLEQHIKPHRTQLPGKGLRQVKNVIAVASGKGGVGKSTIAINLATALARAGARVGLLDADIYGPSVPLMLGKTAPVEVSGEHYIPVKAHGIQAMSIGYLTDGEAALIWRGPMLAKSLIQMLDITLWDDLDYLFIDLPPGTGDIQLSLVQKIPLAGAVIVTTPQHVATMDAQKAIKMFDKTSIYTLGIIENMSQHICSQCGHQDDIFGHGGASELSTIFGCDVLGQLPLDARIGSECDQGIPTATTNHDLASAFMKTALRTAIELNKRPLNYADKFPPIVSGSLPLS
ncbi:MAG: iron-sulfur cluster carrier protein ApbC [Legionellaceae bacterium]|nr:iron-sulfur cluster carrier protein ApbC [Legionellaceae bacterium]